MDLGDYCLKHPSGKDFCKDIGISFEPKGDILMDIRLDNISKSFGDKKVLTNFSAVIKKGKVTCIMGPSGCGKTTLLNIMAGLLTPDEGNITGIPERKSAVFQEERLCETFAPYPTYVLFAAKRKNRNHKGPFKSNRFGRQHE